MACRWHFISCANGWADPAKPRTARQGRVFPPFGTSGCVLWLCRAEYFRLMQPLKDHAMTPELFPTSTKAIQKALAVQLARAGEIGDREIGVIAERIHWEGAMIGRIDICSVGTCVDYFWRTPPKLDDFVSTHNVKDLTVFKWGIIDPDFFRVQVAIEQPELQGRRGL
jgi:hypothetical protein